MKNGIDEIQQECMRRKITRLCHFTQSRNLAHLFADSRALLSRKVLEANDLPCNPSDPERWDGRPELICCTIEFPNPWYFARARQRDPLFQDWVVLLLKPDLIWKPDTEFCPCNAAKERGRYIGRGYKAFLSLFAPSLPGGGERGPTHLDCAPTNLQAEVLIQGPVPLDDIIGIAVQSVEQAKREILRAQLQGFTIDKPIVVAPDFYDKDKLIQSVQNGKRIVETRFSGGERYA